MKEEDTLMIKIDAYLKGHLSEEETTAFAQEIATDRALSQRVAQQQVYLQALDLLLADDLRAKMNNWAEETDELIQSKRWQKWYLGLGVLGVLAYAALCLLANEQKQEAVQRLTKIAADNGHAYSNKAKNDLKTLK